MSFVCIYSHHFIEKTIGVSVVRYHPEYISPKVFKAKLLACHIRYKDNRHMPPYQSAFLVVPPEDLPCTSLAEKLESIAELLFLPPARFPTSRPTLEGV